MIGHISHATVYVGSQDDAKAYYTGKLGFTETSDVDMGNGIRWLTVLPPGGQTHLVLYLGGDDATKGQKPVGGWTSMVLHCADIDATYKELTANGVNMTEPSDVPWGRHAMLTDPDGNVFNVVQPRG